MLVGRSLSVELSLTSGALVLFTMATTRYQEEMAKLLSLLYSTTESVKAMQTQV